jgi:adenine phosphoribosyltransferase
VRGTGELHDRLKSAFLWREDPVQDTYRADITGWWRDPEILSELGPGLAGLFSDQAVTVVLGVQSRGGLLGALVAQALGIGLVEVRKDPRAASHNDGWLHVATPPDHEDKQVSLGFRRELISSSDRVLLVDDWIATGAQASAAQKLVAMSGANWLGAAVVVDALDDHQLRRHLGVRSLLHLRDL